MVYGLLVEETLLMSYGFDTWFDWGGLASMSAPAEGMVVNANGQVSVGITPIKISPNKQMLLAVYHNCECTSIGYPSKGNIAH